MAQTRHRRRPQNSLRARGLRILAVSIAVNSPEQASPNVEAAPTQQTPTRHATLAARSLRLLDTALGLTVIAAVVLNVANIVGRYVFGRAVIGADEVLVYMMMAIVFLGTISVTARDAHLRMDMLVALASPRDLKWIRSVEWLAVSAITGLVAWIGARTAFQLYVFGQKSLSAGLPMWLPHAVVATGLGVVSLIALSRFVRSAAKRASCAASGTKADAP